MSEAVQDVIPDSRLTVISGIALSDGSLNVSDAQIISNIRASIRRGHPQAKPAPIQPDRVLLVAGGPSLAATEAELVSEAHAGALIVTVNGGYHWCLERHLRPSCQIVVDARPFNARFLQPAVPRCRYLVASQCAPETWDAVQGREHVWIWHATGEDDTAIKAELDAYYLGHWMPVAGGVTVAVRALLLLRQLGYVRFDLFGVDCCWMADQHHSYPQAENDADQQIKVHAATKAPDGRLAPSGEFIVAPWHLKQLESFLQLMKLYGDQFLIHVHGDGLLAFALGNLADFQLVSSQ